MLAQANLWYDIIGVVILLIVAIVPVYFLAMNLVTGRLKERFIDYHWHYLEFVHIPWEEEHPMPIRIWHWTNLTCFAIFFTTGFYIRYPFFSGGREIMRYLHYVAMYVVVGIWMYRIQFMFRSGDWKNFTYSMRDIKTSIQVVLYYVGLRPSYDHVSKYHPIQRMTYISIYALLPIQAYTGFALIWPTILLAPVAGFAGGIANAAAWSRFIHASLMRVFMLLVGIHAVLAILEGFPGWKYFWFGMKDPLPNAHPSKEGHGH
jgi:thiosulfate reductase cytochrome b subunit